MRVQPAASTPVLPTISARAGHGLDLSRRRGTPVAEVVRRTLRPEHYHLTVRGRGEADSLVPNTDEASRRMNRRVEITYRTG